MKPTRYARAPRIVRCDLPSGEERYVVRWTEPGRVSRKKFVRTFAEAEAIARRAPRLTNRTTMGVLTNRLTVDAETGCWNVSGSIASNGYPRMSRDGKDVNTHRVMFENWYGDVPEGAQLDHVCRNHRCCNPEHLEPVTQAENIARGMSPGAVAVRSNRCRRGHAFTPENTYTKPSTGHRMCRTCRREHWKRNGR